ncbi:MarR family transcriptional regulator [Vibrio viridaestus]|uniref:MarR family transcriptional regulator n=1 Tax=Vibrio viridaestus TaxID=2487322 RepID=A0A3N9U5S2_9VIBR|nr:MarR family transcriptional regulator [Vibrio viridaestus]RQW65062.1 MarR family transcriptional regulator [Vibrio viridaestus]
MNIHLDILKELSLAEKLAKISRLWKTVADAELTPLGLTHSRWTALWKLRRLGDSVSQKCLAESLEIELASLMRTLNQLEEQHLVVRHTCPHDKRARIVTLTNEGKAVLENIENKVLSVRRTLLKQLDENEINHLNQLLDKIALNAHKAIDEKAQ